MRLFGEKEYYWQFVIDREGNIKGPVRPIDAKQFNKKRFYFNDDSCRMYVLTDNPIHWVIEKDGERTYVFRNREEAEDFIKNI